jgi:peroxiredoxin
VLSLLETLARRLLGRGRRALLAVGALAPEFRVADHTGRVHTLAEYRGRRIVLWFYPKAATPG